MPLALRVSQVIAFVVMQRQTQLALVRAQVILHEKRILHAMLEQNAGVNLCRRPGVAATLFYL